MYFISIHNDKVIKTNRNATYKTTDEAYGKALALAKAYNHIFCDDMATIKASIGTKSVGVVNSNGTTLIRYSVRKLHNI